MWYRYKEDVNLKDSLILKENEDYQKLLTSEKMIKEEIEQFKNQNELAQAYLKSQIIEEYKLDQFVKETEVERNRQQNALK